MNRLPLKQNREAHDLDHDHLHLDHDYGGDHPQIEHQRVACCAHEHSETGVRNRLLFVFAGAICLVLSGLWRWLRPDQAELFELWAMIGAVITAIPILRDALVGLVSRGMENTEVCMTQFITIAVIACFVTGHYVTGALVAIILQAISSKPQHARHKRSHQACSNSRACALAGCAMGRRSWLMQRHCRKLTLCACDRRHHSRGWPRGRRVLNGEPGDNHWRGASD